MKNPLVERPWLLIIAALAIFVAVWIAFLVVAERHKPAEVPRPSSIPVR